MEPKINGTCASCCDNTELTTYKLCEQCWLLSALGNVRGELTRFGGEETVRGAELCALVDVMSAKCNVMKHELAVETMASVHRLLWRATNYVEALKNAFDQCAGCNEHYKHEEAVFGGEDGLCDACNAERVALICIKRIEEIAALAEHRSAAHLALRAFRSALRDRDVKKIVELANDSVIDALISVANELHEPQLDLNLN
mgnify:CR=1 FL=1